MNKDKVYEFLKAYLKDRISCSPFNDKYCALNYMMCLKCEYCAKYFGNDRGNTWNSILCVGRQLEHNLR